LKITKNWKISQKHAFFLGGTHKPTHNPTHNPTHISPNSQNVQKTAFCLRRTHVQNPCQNLNQN
jgi:hypothetical protein